MADRHAAAYSEAMANFKDAFMVVMTGELMVGVIISCDFLYFYVKNTKIKYLLFRILYIFVDSYID